MKQKKTTFYKVISCIILIVLTSCHQKKVNDLKSVETQSIDSNIKIKTITQNFDSTKQKYKKLIPIFDGLFITYSQFDTASLRKLAINKIIDYNFQFNVEFHSEKIQKWGVIDSIGNIIVPFICDGARGVSANEGVISVYYSSHMLNTGIPRYAYYGTCYKFNKEGIINDWNEKFDLSIVFNGMHQHEFVINQGNNFYLPNKYRKKDRDGEPSINK